MQTQDLFEVEKAADTEHSLVQFSREQPMDRAMRLIREVFDDRHIAVLAYSGGRGLLVFSAISDGTQS